MSNLAQIKLGNQMVPLKEGEWSSGSSAEFVLIPHISSVRGMVRVFAKQLHPAIRDLCFAD